MGPIVNDSGLMFRSPNCDILRYVATRPYSVVSPDYENITKLKAFVINGESKAAIKDILCIKEFLAFTVYGENDSQGCLNSESGLQFQVAKASHGGGAFPQAKFYVEQKAARAF